ncbi:hypothetical protein pb186bvf_013044 [Paramecium bursaria]
MKAKYFPQRNLSNFDEQKFKIIYFQKENQTLQNLLQMKVQTLYNIFMNFDSDVERQVFRNCKLRILQNLPQVQEKTYNFIRRRANSQQQETHQQKKQIYSFSRSLRHGREIAIKVGLNSLDKKACYLYENRKSISPQIQKKKTIMSKTTQIVQTDEIKDETSQFESDNKFKKQPSWILRHKLFHYMNQPAINEIKINNIVKEQAPLSLWFNNSVIQKSIQTVAFAGFSPSKTPRRPKSQNQRRRTSYYDGIFQTVYPNK